ncbi:MAG: sulfotransferase family 2 domain-containing protein [Pseudomonadota bacterium]
MIISHKHKFIFLKTCKTAGTSVEFALRSLCGPDDIIAPIGDEEGIKMGLPQQNYTSSPQFPSRDWLYWFRSRLMRKSAPKDFYNHIPGWRVRARVGEDVWNDYFKFCFERNPWDREVSFYFFRHGRSGYADNFADHLKLLKRKKLRNWEIYTDYDKPLVDFVGRYENLESDLKLALQKCGIDWTGELPRAKAKFRADKRPYRELYDDRSRELVARTYRREIEYFGYEF